MLQEGPMCGLVALHMALEAFQPLSQSADLHRKPTDLLRHGREKVCWVAAGHTAARFMNVVCWQLTLLNATGQGYTIQGEMFRATWLADLARSSFPEKHVQVQNVPFELSSTARCLAAGGIVVVRPRALACADRAAIAPSSLEQRWPASQRVLTCASAP